MKSSPKKQKPYVSGDYDKIKNELPENLRKFCDIINKDFISKDNPDIGDLQGVTYDAVGKKLKFPLDDYTDQGMNLLIRLVRRTAKLPEFSSMLKFDREALEDGYALLKIKTEPTIKENKEVKIKLSEVRHFQKIAGLLNENDSDILSKLQTYIINDYVTDQGYGSEVEKAKMENDSIESEIIQIKGQAYFDDLKKYADLETYRSEYGGPEDAEEIEQEMEMLATKLGYTVDQLNSI